MEGVFNSRRRGKRPAINITSLIDVMFILLIFLMVTTTFREHLGLDIELPEASTATEEKLTSNEIVVDKEGAYYFAQHPVNDAQLRDSMESLLKSEPDASIVLRADDGADFGRVLHVIDMARDIGGNRLIIPTREDRREGSFPGP